MHASEGSATFPDVSHTSTVPWVDTIDSYNLLGGEGCRLPGGADVCNDRYYTTSIIIITITRLTAPFPGLPGWAGNSKNFTGYYWSKTQWVEACTSLQTDNHASTPPLSVLQAGCPSCRPTNSVKTLKAHRWTWKLVVIVTPLTPLYPPSSGVWIVLLYVKGGIRSVSWSPHRLILYSYHSILQQMH